MIYNIFVFFLLKYLQVKAFTRFSLTAKTEKTRKRNPFVLFYQYFSNSRRQKLLQTVVTEISLHITKSNISQPYFSLWACWRREIADQDPVTETKRNTIHSDSSLLSPFNTTKTFCRYLCFSNLRQLTIGKNHNFFFCIRTHSWGVRKPCLLGHGSFAVHKVMPSW